jgi:hypothetical protein
LEISRDKATAFLAIKKKADERKAEKLTEQIANARAHIKLVLRTIQEIMDLNKNN